MTNKEGDRDRERTTIPNPHPALRATLSRWERGKPFRPRRNGTRYNETMRSKKLYKVTFLSQGKTLELYARHVGSSALWGFTEVGELVFEQGDGVVVDPTEERLHDEFKNTKMLHLPMQCLVRIEEVEKLGPLAIRDAASGDKIMPFPIAPPRTSGK